MAWLDASYTPDDLNTAIRVPLKSDPDGPSVSALRPE